MPEQKCSGGFKIKDSDDARPQLNATGFKSANKEITRATQDKLIVQKGHEKLYKAGRGCYGTALGINTLDLETLSPGNLKDLISILKRFCLPIHVSEALPKMKPSDVFVKDTAQIYFYKQI